VSFCTLQLTGDTALLLLCESTVIDFIACSTCNTDQDTTAPETQQAGKDLGFTLKAESTDRSCKAAHASKIDATCCLGQLYALHKRLLNGPEQRNRD
jgi:hypothetical protein